MFALFFALLGIEALILHAGFELAYRSSVLMMCFSAMLFILAYLSLAALLTLLVRNLALGLSLVAIIASPALGYAAVGLPVPATNRFAKAWGASLAMRWYQLLLFGRSAANVFTVTPAYSALTIRPHRRRRAHLKKLTGSPDARLISRPIMSGAGSMSVFRVLGLANGSSLAAGSGTSIRRDRHRRRPLGLWRVTIALPAAACNYAPTMNLLGSYFPAWMLCAAAGIVAAVVIRQILAAAGVGDYVVAPLLTYAGLAVSATLLAWLLWFGH